MRQAPARRVQTAEHPCIMSAGNLTRADWSIERLFLANIYESSLVPSDWPVPVPRRTTDRRQGWRHLGSLHEFFNNGCGLSVLAHIGEVRDIGAALMGGG